jgi:A/G-specific adenine glycosylase
LTVLLCENGAVMSTARAHHRTLPAAAGIPARDWPLFRRRLSDWFRRAKRDLPWRATRDPYRIWISEIMLQQTRVAAVIPYYLRFLKRFPTVRRLARAPSAQVLGAWSGLGYYSRARNLHRAAREIVARRDGKFPCEWTAALALPGIGPYTAAAILSIACDQPLAVLDGNVARVLARLGAVRRDLRRPAEWRRLEAAAGALLARDAPGEWNQAMMELGATVCTPRAPRCSTCPVERWCRARALGLAERLPIVPRKRRALKVTVAAAVLLDPRGRTLLLRHRNGDGSLFSHLWQFPAVQTHRNASRTLAAYLSRITRAYGHAAVARGARPGVWDGAPRLFDLMPETAMQPLAPARHAVTFRDVHLRPFLLRVARLPIVPGARTPPLSALDRLPVSNATRKIAAAALRADRTFCCSSGRPSPSLGRGPEAFIA